MRMAGGSSAAAWTPASRAAVALLHRRGQQGRSRHDGQIAFNALRDLRFKSMIIRLDGDLAGEFAARLNIDGVGLGQHEHADGLSAACSARSRSS